MGDERPTTLREIRISEERYRELQRAERAANGSKERIGFSANTWMGLVVIALTVVAMTAALLVTTFMTNTGAQGAALEHQTRGHPDIREDVREAKRKAGAAVHNTIAIGTKLGVRGLKTGDE